MMKCTCEICIKDVRVGGYCFWCVQVGGWWGTEGWAWLSVCQVDALALRQVRASCLCEGYLAPEGVYGV